MRRIILLFVFCLSATISWAQIKDIEFIAGPNMGMLRSNLVTPGTETKPSYHSKMGYTIGVGSNYFLSENFSLGARLLYQRTNVRGDFAFEGNSYVGNLELTTSFDYISLPVMVRYTIGKKVKFSGELGGFVNYLLNSSAKDYIIYDSQVPNYVDYNSMNTFLAEATEQYTRFDAGLSVGFSSQVPLGEKLSVKMSVYDNYGLVNISALQFAYSPNRSSNYLKSNTVNLLAGIVYSLY